MGGGITVDASGNAIVTGSKTQCSSSFPVTAGAVPGTTGWCDGFLAKLNATGTSLIFASDVGGQHVALDGGGNIYVAGDIGDRFTYSSPFLTTPNVFRSECRRGDYAGTSDAFIAKVDPTGAGLVYATCLAGNITGLAVDATGNAYVTGTTNSSDFTTTAWTLRATGNKDCNADLDQGWFPTHADCEIFVAKLNQAGTRLIYSTYVAGSDPINAYSRIALDAPSNAYITGATYVPTSFPVTPGSFSNELNWTGFLAKLNSTGSALIDPTCLPSSLATQQLAVDAQGNAYVAGWTVPQDSVVSTPGVLQTSFGGGYADGFVTKVRLRDSPILPAFDSRGIVNAASFLPDPIAPGELVTLFGTGFGPRQFAVSEVNANGRVSSLSTGTRVLFNGIAAPVIYAAENQVSAVVP